MTSRSEPVATTDLVKRTDREWLEAFRRGERVKNEHTMTYFTVSQEHSPHRWRVIVCATDAEGRERDVVECSQCGLQCETSCDFDEDMS